MTPSRSAGRRRLRAAAVACAVLPALLSGCGAEAVELVREIEAARGECTRAGLRTSDEECVRMMERYAALGTDLVHTYLGGLKALDVALDRIPPPGFDTSGVGYAISPELRRGDPTGAGGSPRLASGPPSYTHGYAPGARASESEVWRSDALSAGAAAPAPRRPAEAAYGAARDRYRDGYWDGYGSYARYGSSGRDHDSHRPGYSGRYGASGRHAGPAVPYTPYAPYAPFGLGGFAPLLDWRSTPFGYGPGSGPTGYSPFAYGGYGPRGGYTPAWPWSGGGYDPYGRYPGYGPYDPYAQPYPYGGFGGYAPRPWVDEYNDLSPADAWGYDDSEDGSGRAPDAAGAADPDSRMDDRAGAGSTAPARPAPHRPGILLPPAERLRRPWLDD